MNDCQEAEDVSEFRTCRNTEVLKFIETCAEETSPFATLFTGCHAPKVVAAMQEADCNSYSVLTEFRKCSQNAILNICKSCYSDN